jgi:hypothetical protein
MSSRVIEDLQNNNHIAVSNPVITRLDRGIQKGTGCPLNTCGHDAQTGMETQGMSIQ